MASDQLSAQAVSWRQHKHLRLTFSWVLHLIRLPWKEVDFELHFPNLYKDNGGTTVANDQPSVQATSWRQHKHLEHRTETFEMVEI